MIFVRRFVLLMFSGMMFMTVNYPYREPVPRDYTIEEFVFGLRATDLVDLYVDHDDPMVDVEPVDDGVDHLFDRVEVVKTDLSDMADACMGKVGVLRCRDARPLLSLSFRGGVFHVS